MERKNPIKRDIVVIGGGASGLFAAILIKAENPKISVAVLESSDRVGKKLLTTGNGRCNLTNMKLTPEMYHGSFKYAAEQLLNALSPADLVELFKSFGMLVTYEQEGLAYPRSKQASTVLDILRLNAKNYSVEIVTNSKVSSISSRKGEYLLTTANNTYCAKKVIIATGGKASPSTGADVSIFESLKALGHTVTPLSPSLCPVTVKSPYTKSLKGVRVKARVSLMKGEKVLKSQSGELQFTDNALSGICIFNLSRLANIANDTEISVNFLEGFSKEEIVSYLEHKIQNVLGTDSTAEELMTGIFHKMISLAILKDAGISPASYIRNFDKKILDKLAFKITDFRFKVVPHSDFTKAQVMAGGIIGKEIDSHTMESKLYKGLYIIGEATDCDGDCGGANLHFAFASAFSAAKGITDVYNK